MRDRNLITSLLIPSLGALSIAVAGLRKGRVYDIRLDDVTDADGEKLLHASAYYTLNELVK